MSHHGEGGGGYPGLSLTGGGEYGFVTSTQTNVHGDALCFMVKTWGRHKTTETVLNGGRRLAAVGLNKKIGLLKDNPGGKLQAFP